jgi:hypothetical protein
MRRLPKILIFGFLVYAVVTATPDQQTRILDGMGAIRDAAIEACQREGSLCSRAFQYVGTAVSQSLTDDPKPWMDDEGKRAATGQTESLGSPKP